MVLALDAANCANTTIVTPSGNVKYLQILPKEKMHPDVSLQKVDFNVLSEGRWSFSRQKNVGSELPLMNTRVYYAKGGF